MVKVYLGIDIGSVSTNLVIIDNDGEGSDALCLRPRKSHWGFAARAFTVSKWSAPSIGAVGLLAVAPPGGRSVPCN